MQQLQPSEHTWSYLNLWNVHLLFNWIVIIIASICLISKLLHITSLIIIRRLKRCLNSWPGQDVSTSSKEYQKNLLVFKINWHYFLFSCNRIFLNLNLLINQKMNRVVILSLFFNIKFVLIKFINNCFTVTCVLKHFSLIIKNK